MKKADDFRGRYLLAVGIAAAVTVLGGSEALAQESGSSAEALQEFQADEQTAEEIALADAGFAAEDVEWLYTERDREDGAPVFEVTFGADGVEYEYLICQEDGSILEWEMDGKDLGDAEAELSLTGESNAAADDAEKRIGMEKAKETALLDAMTDSEQARFTKIKFEKDDRKTAYEVEFYAAGEEYEYTIDAYTGEVLKRERD